MIHKSSLGLDDSNHRQFNQRNEMFPSWGSAGDIVECLPHNETFSSGTVRRKNKRERNRTNPEGNSGTLIRNTNRNENGANSGVGKSSTSLESTSDLPDITQHRIISDSNPRIPNNIDAYGVNNTTKRSKSRSKSRSPTRSNDWLDDDLDIPPPPPPPHQVCHHHQSSLSHMSENVHRHHQELSGSEGAAEIVIVHRGLNQPTCSLHQVHSRSKNHLNRNASPDNISESSISFHENEFAGQSNQHTSNIHTKSQSHKHNQDKKFSTSTSSRQSNQVMNKASSSDRGRIEYADKYENQESVRESWGTSSSSDRLTTINQGVQGANDRNKDFPNKYSHQSRLKDSGVSSHGSQPEKKFGDSPASLHQKQYQQARHLDKTSTLQRQHHHHQKVCNCTFLGNPGIKLGNKY